ncbi:cysteine-rich RECEPTOR-like kinase [Rhynchospora pubera]|uniref:Cysteine-rich RECEPTOR-like kinase n=1 Tax=Rhynchospora pubera TaxID=906938 RepID=A0AAV8FD37_9POAL|nr:cysteine-rich RECEPTOR-like kinase [Rhynchospora pubera]
MFVKHLLIENIMLQASLSILLLCAGLVLTVLPIQTRAYFVAAHCSATDTYASGSPFEYNLQSLLKFLYTNATFHGGFDSLSVGNDQDKVYGLLMCFGDDVSQESCWRCLQDATTEAPQRCPGNATASIFYSGCILRYSHKDFRLQAAYFNDNDCVPNENSTFDEASKNLLPELISNASIGAENDPKLIAYRETKTNTRNISAFVQCTLDLSPDGCRQCLQEAVVDANGFSACSDNMTRNGIMLWYKSCYVRYESYYITLPTYPGTPVIPSVGIAPSPLATPARGSKSHSTVVIVVSTVVTSVVAGLVAFGLWVWRLSGARKNDEEYLQETVQTELKYILNPNAEYQVFNFTILKFATDDFSDMRKLGKGGFGSVYKGILPDGQEIAVKRLAGGSDQGITEFKNEVDFLAKLKHKNLVQLLGCCITNQEKLLCYEYLPNGSLDKILFARDMSRRAELCWKLRYKIIEGISNGLHYLHEESRLKIIHRDLKVSNILLDKDMNPKIADFGLARFFEEEETHKETNILAGTFGYMAPEYIFYGNFSAKSDVYSFGILLLEILTGQKNSSFVGSGRISNFIEHALIHWNNDTVSQLKDPALEEDCIKEIKRCAHIALLCVQEDPTNRPTMATIRHMLGSPSLTIPDLPSVWSPFGQLNFPISSESSTTKTSTNKSQAESSKSTTNEREYLPLINDIN